MKSLLQGNYCSVLVGVLLLCSLVRCSQKYYQSSGVDEKGHNVAVVSFHSAEPKPGDRHVYSLNWNGTPHLNEDDGKPKERSVKLKDHVDPWNISINGDNMEHNIFVGTSEGGGDKQYVKLNYRSSGVDEKGHNVAVVSFHSAEPKPGDRHVYSLNWNGTPHLNEDDGKPKERSVKLKDYQ
eukprot:498550_1